MIVRGHERLLVQGITGRQGSFWTAHMQAYGTRVMGGVNPRKAGTRHCGVPVYESARAAMDDAGFDVSVLFIPPLGVRDAAVDAIEAGARKLVILTEHVPVQDVLYRARRRPRERSAGGRSEHRGARHTRGVLRGLHARIRFPTSSSRARSGSSRAAEASAP